MARGADSKLIFTQWLISNYDGAFVASDGKTIRIPMVENGEQLELKVTLTAAKDIEGGSIAMTTQAEPDGDWCFEDGPTEKTNTFEPAQVTQEEQDRINALMNKLGI